MKDLTFNAWIILFMIAAAQGFFLSFVIFSRKSRVNNLLGLLIMVFSICLTYYVAFWTGYYKKIPVYFAVLQGTTYLLGPLVYFYIRSGRNKIYFSYLHFIPFFLYVFYFASIPYWIRTGMHWVITLQVAIQNLHLIIYGYLTYNRSARHGNFHNGELKIYKWRKKIALCFNGYTYSFLSYYILVWTGTLKIEYDYMISLASSFLIYFTGYYGFIHPEVFRYFEKEKYERSSLSRSAAGSILDAVKKYFEDEKPFLDSDLKMTDVAGKLNLSPHHISQAINELEKVNFSDFVNQYRVAEAQRILTDSNPINLKLIQVAFDSGFNNKTSFHSAFKKITGLSPTNYRKTISGKFLSLQTQH